MIRERGFGREIVTCEDTALDGTGRLLASRKATTPALVLLEKRLAQCQAGVEDVQPIRVVGDARATHWIVAVGAERAVDHHTVGVDGNDGEVAALVENPGVVELEPGAGASDARPAAIGPSRVGVGCRGDVAVERRRVLAAAVEAQHGAAVGEHPAAALGAIADDAAQGAAGVGGQAATPEVEASAVVGGLVVVDESIEQADDARRHERRAVDAAALAVGGVGRAVARDGRALVEGQRGAVGPAVDPAAAAGSDVAGHRGVFEGDGAP